MNSEPRLVAHELRPRGKGEAPPMSLALNAGLVCIVGPERERLSTYLQMLAGVGASLSGELRLLGCRVHGLDADDWSSLRRRVGLVIPQAPLLSIMSGLRNVMLPALYHGLASEQEVKRRVHALLDELHYDANHDVLPAYMSKLQSRHLLIARALILEPSILMLDQPFTGLDAAACAALQDYICGAVQRRVPLVLAAVNDVSLAQRADTLVFVGNRSVLTFERWDALLGSDDTEVMTFVHEERRRCAVFG